MLGEDDQLAAMAVGIEHLGVVLQEPGEFVPLPVGARLPNLVGQFFQVLQHPDFDLQFGDRAGRRCLIDDLLFGLLDLGVGGVVQIVEVFVGVRRAGRRSGRRGPRRRA